MSQDSRQRSTEITYEKKKEILLRQMREYAGKDVLVAFSGGVDSSVLVALAVDATKKAGPSVLAVTMQGDLTPKGQEEKARLLAEQLGARHEILSLHELAEADISENPKDRCYRCKKYLFTKLWDYAAAQNISIILEGTNADDLCTYRPGIRAIRELSVESPLAKAGLTKQEVRRLARELSLPVADQPSAPCLATRFPYGTRLTAEALEKVEQAENWIRAQGIGTVRVRVYDNLVRIETAREEFQRILAMREELTAMLKELGYVYITLDLEGFRSGSMDEVLQEPQQEPLK